jgi:hypothetical protein
MAFFMFAPQKKRRIHFFKLYPALHGYWQLQPAGTITPVFTLQPAALQDDE